MQLHYQLRNLRSEYWDGASPDWYETPAWQQFAEQAVKVIPAMIGAGGHYAGLHVARERELGQSVGAAYTADHGGVIIWRATSAAMMQKFLRGDYRQFDERTQLAFLARIKLELAMFLHEGIHGTGSPDQETFERDYVRDVRSPQLTAMKEGVTDLAARTWLDRFIVTMGLDRIDPRLRAMSLPDGVGYPGQVEVMRAVITGCARAQGHGFEDELLRVLRDGAGSRALSLMLQRTYAAQGITGVAAQRAVSEAMPAVVGQAYASYRSYMGMLQQSEERYVGPDEVSSGFAMLRRDGKARGERALAQLAEIGQRWSRPVPQPVTPAWSTRRPVWIPHLDRGVLHLHAVPQPAVPQSRPVFVLAG